MRRFIRLTIKGEPLTTFNSKSKNSDSKSSNLEKGFSTYFPELAPPKTAKIPEYKVFNGKYITLKKLDMQDIKSLYESTHGSFNLESVWQYMSHGPFKSLTDMKIFFQEYIKEKKMVYCVHDIKSDDPIGIVCLMDINPDMASIEIGGILYPKSSQKTMANTEASYLLIKECIENLGYRRITWKCNNENVASKNAAVRLGFELEGLLYNHMIIKGKNRDTAWFGLIDQKWHLLIKNYENYLYNQTINNQQKISLALLNAQVPKFTSC